MEYHYHLEKCEECGKADLVVNNVEGTISCQSCGLV
jgi:ribosomal protein S27E